jgi:predicted RNase H-like HicB family nuclease
MTSRGPVDVIMPDARLRIEIEREQDGRFIAEVPELPGTLAYGRTREEATARVQALALRVLADRLEHGEDVPPIVDAFLVAP